MSSPIISKALTLLDQMYIDPLRDPARRATYLAVFCLLFGGYFLELYYALSGTSDIKSLFLLLGIAQTSGSMLVTLMVILFMKLPKKLTIPFSLTYPCAVLSAAAFIEHPAFTGLALGSACGIGWAWTHMLFKSSTTANNRSAQVAAGANASLAGQLASALVAGILASLSAKIDLGPSPLIISIIFLTGSIIAVVSCIDTIEFPKDSSRQFRRLPTTFARSPLRAARTLFSGAIELLGAGVAGSMLSLAGIAPVASGGLIALGAVAQLGFNGLIGKLNHKNRLNGFRIAAVAKVVAWLPWSLGLNALGAAVSPALWRIAFSSMGPSSTTEWYDDDGLLPLAARDLGIGLGRALATIVLMYVAMDPIVRLPLFGMACGAALGLLSLPGMQCRPATKNTSETVE